MAATLDVFVPVHAVERRDQSRGVSRISKTEYIPKFAKGRVNVLLWLKWGIMWNVELGCWLLNKGKVDERD